MVAGNHDAHLQELISNRINRELMIGRFAFLHGDKNPSEEAMMCDYLITAHSHTAVRIADKNGAMYEEKAWVVAGVDKKLQRKHSYAQFNKRIKLIIDARFQRPDNGHADRKRPEKPQSAVQERAIRLRQRKGIHPGRIAS